MVILAGSIDMIGIVAGAMTLVIIGGNLDLSVAGNIAMTKALAKELGKFNVNVNCVAPGMVMTEMAESIPPEFLNAAVKETVLGRIATPDDVANVVAFLCSDASRHITGEVIKVDGGQYI
jgi:3-oxoacyl-[acyl-carrier protein] reductase